MDHYRPLMGEQLNPTAGLTSLKGLLVTTARDCFTGSPDFKSSIIPKTAETNSVPYKRN